MPLSEVLKMKSNTEKMKSLQSDLEDLYDDLMDTNKAIISKTILHREVYMDSLMDTLRKHYDKLPTEIKEKVELSEDS